MPDLRQHEKNAARLQAERDTARRAALDLDERREAAEHARAVAESARDVVSEVLVLTQRQVKGYLEEVVSLALSAVYGDDHGLELEFGVKRNQSEVTPWVVRGGDRFSTRDEVGGGVLDVASLGMRLGMYALSQPRPAPLLVLDEPAKFLSRDRQAAFGRMIREMSRRLGIQVILVSHSEAIIDQADRAYRVVQEDGVSRAEVVS